jgi:hypothetical protein
MFHATVVPAPVFTLSQLRIAADNALENAAITASSTATGFDARNVVDGRAGTYWRPANAVAQHSLLFVLPEAKWVDYFALYSNDLSVQRAAATFQYSTDGVNFTTLCTVTPRNTAPVHISFTKVFAGWFRVLIDGPNTKPSIAVIAAGEEFRPEKGVCVGFTPPTLGGMPTVLTNNSMATTWLGRALRSRVPYEGEVPLDYINPERARLVYAPLFKRLSKKPFFLKWHGYAFPYETAYCWTESTDVTASYMKPTFMKATIKYVGLVE